MRLQCCAAGWTPTPAAFTHAVSHTASRFVFLWYCTYSFRLAGMRLQWRDLVGPVESRTVRPTPSCGRRSSSCGRNARGSDCCRSRAGAPQVGQGQEVLGGRGSTGGSRSGGAGVGGALQVGQGQEVLGWEGAAGGYWGEGHTAGGSRSGGAGWEGAAGGYWGEGHTAVGTGVEVLGERLPQVSTGVLRWECYSIRAKALQGGCWGGRGTAGGSRVVTEVGMLQE